MKELISDEERSLQDEDFVFQSLDSNDKLVEDGASVCSLSGDKSSLQKNKATQHMILEGSKCIDTNRCVKKSHIQKQCDSEVTIQNWRDINNLRRNMAQYIDRFSEFRSSHSLSIICRSPSRFHIPLNLSSSSFLVDSANARRRTRSTDDLGNFIIEYASEDGPKNVIINPYGKWIIDAAERNDKVRNIVRQSLLLTLGDLENSLRLSRAVSVNASGTKSPLQKILPNRPDDTSPVKFKSEDMPLNKLRSALVTSSEMFKPCSSSISAGSSTNFTTYKGLLHCLWRGGIPYFVFMVEGKGEEIYVANPWKVSSSVDKTLDYMYLFHSCSCQRKSLARWGNNTSDLVGKMKVSNSLSLNSNRSRFLETEFVLFGATEDHAREIQRSAGFLENRRLSKKMTDIFGINYSSKLKCRQQKGSQCDFEELFPSVNKLNMFDKCNGVDLLEEHLPPNLELAAIVIKDHQNEHGKETVVGGWGLKFLEKTTVDRATASVEVSSSPKSCHESSVGEKTGHSRSINVLVPAGFHGGPLTRIGGPSSLTERWRSGGRCDCGGWDIGCPLTVLNSGSDKMGALKPQEYPQEDQKAFDLFTEGTKQGEPILRMVNMQEGLYFVDFQSSLSALQSFSIGVAMIHAQTPAIRENCKYCT
uniref:Lysine--tRNA ligase n=1 Tax=Anthurium amnicola TaxID=1678845 RepID=A0A1D1YT40_9ARAE